jgi:hypothetical protein
VSSDVLSHFRQGQRWSPSYHDAPLPKAEIFDQQSTIYYVWFLGSNMDNMSYLKTRENINKLVFKIEKPRILIK